MIVGIGTSLLQIAEYFLTYLIKFCDDGFSAIPRFNCTPTNKTGDIVCTCTVRHILSILTTPKDSPVSIYDIAKKTDATDFYANAGVHCTAEIPKIDK